jgi:hypothetical protein
MEVVSQSHVAKRQQFLAPEDFKTLYSTSETLARMLSGLRVSLARPNGRRRTLSDLTLNPQLSTLNSSDASH